MLHIDSQVINTHFSNSSYNFDFDAMQQFFEQGNTLNYTFRKQKLEKLKLLIEIYEEEITEALHKDLHKSAAEAFTTEIGFLYAEIDYTIKHLHEWMEPETVSTPVIIQPSNSKIYKEPLGIVLIIAPWNYPFQLAIAPLIGAIAGGNCSVIKPSELAPHTSALIAKIINSNFNPHFIRVVEGDGAVVIPELMKNHRFNHVFFTGSTFVGKIIANLAAEKLVTTTLELGGKSPCIVAEDADITVAANRIVWGKFTNAGQTCVAPDYLLVHESRKNELVLAISKALENFYSSNAFNSGDYGRIINKRRWQTLTSYLSLGNVILGGKTDEETLFIEPTLIENVDANSAIMQDEIFGPILPIITYQSINNALAFIRKFPQPLSAYLFTQNKETEKLFTTLLSFGGGCVNNTLVHLANPELPFGGAGFSGIGQYHGKYSFNCFTRQKAVLKSATWIDPSIKYPPYGQKLKWLKLLIKNL